jgi:hypothetical protein
MQVILTGLSPLVPDAEWWVWQRCLLSGSVLARVLRELVGLSILRLDGWCVNTTMGTMVRDREDPYEKTGSLAI